MAQANNAGVLGVAHSAGQVRVFKVCSNAATGGCWDDALASALLFIEATVSPARHIINMSLGGPNVAKPVKQALTRLYEDGHLLVAAAGNVPNNWNHVGVFDPARHPDVIAVSGTLESDAFASSMYCNGWYDNGYAGSQSGPEVELAAPFWTYGTISQGSYGLDCGTSFSAPFVSAVAAMVWTKNPQWSNEQVRNHLRATAVDLGSAGRDNLFGFGRIAAYAAISDSVVQPPPNHTATILGPSAIKPNVQCYWTAMTSIPNPSFSWRVNGVVVGSGAQFYHNASADFDLALEASGSGFYAGTNRSIVVSSANPDCLDY